MSTNSILKDFPVALPDALWGQIIDAYATPKRAYHNFDHIKELWGHYLEVKNDKGWHFPKEVALALLYHDIIYVAGKSDNETLSAQLVQQHLMLLEVSQDIDIQMIMELIEHTSRHGALKKTDLEKYRNPHDLGLFLDCDMAILGSAPERFDHYNSAIAHEYSGVVPGWLYKIKRKQFLKQVLQQDRIFFTDYFHSRYDHQARANLRRAINMKQ